MLIVGAETTTIKTHTSGAMNNAGGDAASRVLVTTREKGSNLIGMVFHEQYISIVRLD